MVLELKCEISLHEIIPELFQFVKQKHTDINSDIILKSVDLFVQVN